MSQNTSQIPSRYKRVALRNTTPFTADGHIGIGLQLQESSGVIRVRFHEDDLLDLMRELTEAAKAFEQYDLSDQD